MGETSSQVSISSLGRITSLSRVTCLLRVTNLRRVTILERVTVVLRDTMVLMGALVINVTVLPGMSKQLIITCLNRVAVVGQCTVDCDIVHGSSTINVQTV